MNLLVKIALPIITVFGVRGCNMTIGRLPSVAQVQEIQNYRFPQHYEYHFIPDIPHNAEIDRLYVRLAKLEQRRSRTPIPLSFETDHENDLHLLNLHNVVDNILSKLSKRDLISVHVRELDTQRVLYDRMGDVPRNPASNQKILTAAAALDLLGPDYTFVTPVFRVGDALVIQGSGDPLFTDRNARELAQKVIDAGSLKKVKRIVVDESIFSLRRFAPGFRTDGAGTAYEAPSGALSLNFNTVEVRVYPRPSRSRPGIRILPTEAPIRLINRARHGRGRLIVRSEELMGAEPTGTRLLVRGRIPTWRSSMRVRRRVYDPGRFAGEVFANILRERSDHPGFKVEKASLKKVTQNERPIKIAEHRSAPLLNTVERILAYSNNFAAEQIVRTIGHQFTGEPGDWDNGIAVLRTYWRVVGNDPESLVLENGSGMSSVGRITARSLVDLLSFVFGNHLDGHGLLSVMPAAGDKGTMRRRLRKAGSRVRAKTGTLEGTTGFSGIVSDSKNRPQIAFSILINQRGNRKIRRSKRRRTENAIVRALLRFTDRKEFVFDELEVFGDPLDLSDVEPRDSESSDESSDDISELLAEIQEQDTP